MIQPETNSYFIDQSNVVLRDQTKVVRRRNVKGTTCSLTCLFTNFLGENFPKTKVLKIPLRDN